MDSNFSWRSCNVRMFLHHFLSKEFQDTSITTRNQCMYRISLYSFAKVYFHIFTYVKYLHIFFTWILFFYYYICTFVPRFKEPETPTRSDSVLLWGPAWVRPFTTWSDGETNTVFVFVFFQSFLRQMRLLCLSSGGICFFINRSTRQKIGKI